MQTDPPIVVTLFGEVSVRLPGRLVTSFRSNRAVALLGYLATHPGRQSREHLAALLWPDFGSDRSLPNLRQTLQYLRHSLDDSFDRLFEVTRSHVAARPESFRCDAALLLACDGAKGDDRGGLCEEAVLLYRGAFLTGIDDSWVSDMRVRLAQVYVRALLYLSDLELPNRPERALALAERAIAEEPHMDGPRARKLQALVRMGERAAALREFESFAEILHDELGIAPSESVRRALDDAPVSAPLVEGLPDQIGIDSDLGFALCALADGDRPHLSVDLAIALTPHWIAVGTPRLGIEAMNRCKTAAAARMKPELRAKSDLCLAELTFAYGDIRRAGDLLESVRPVRHLLPNPFAARALLLEGRVALAEVEGRAALNLAAEGLALIEGGAEDSIELDLRLLYANGALHVHDLPAALQASDRAVALATKSQERVMSGIALGRRAQVLTAMGRIEEAEATALHSLEFTTGILTGRARAHRLQIARLLEDLGQLDAAEEGYRHVIAETERVEAAFDEVCALTYLGDLVHARGHPRSAISLHTKALGIRRKLNQTLGVATSLRGLGRALLDVGDLEQAREALVESAELFRAHDATPGYASVLFALAQVETRAGNTELGVRLAKRALRLFQGMSPLERLSNGRSGATAIEDARALIERFLPCSLAERA